MNLIYSYVLNCFPGIKSYSSWPRESWQ